MKINPTALAFYAFAYLVGYLYAGQHAGLIGLCIALGISVGSALIR